ncbi:MAG: M3 family metallopeptidase [Gammaproteobacteria bacterium]|nr:M3 family metallopeptidase [Gammaproteobacteria bacterium]
MDDNPLLDLSGLPRFGEIRPEHVQPAVERVLADNRAALVELLASPEPRSFARLVLALERLGHRLARVWSPVSHLNGVTSTPELRDAYNHCLPLLSEYATELGQNRALCTAMQQIEQSDEPLDASQRMLLAQALRDFRLAGVDLPPPQQQRFGQLMQEISMLQATFQQNVLDATDSWRHHATRETEVAGLPESTRRSAARAAREAGQDGWLFGLDAPTYVAVMTHADDAGLRETFYRGWVTRASDQGRHEAELDNSRVIERLLACRHEAATLLGFDSYAELSLARKMAGSVDEVVGFLDELAARCRPQAAREFAELEALAGRPLAAWDIGYFAEKLREQRFSLSDEQLKPWFPVPRVLTGMFGIAERLYGLKIRHSDGVASWHPAVEHYTVDSAEGERIGGFYVDLYARPGKRTGAWMDECVVRAALGEDISHPVAYLVCNFTPPEDDQPSLLGHQDVVTLFHEFGHTLHHLLTRVDYPSLAGINGVAWDAVELPSQFFENYAWLDETLPLISGHHATGEPLPGELLGRLRASRAFHAGLQTLRQIEFALFDFRLHAGYDPQAGSRVDALLAEVRREVAVTPAPDWNRFAHSFSHIFGGGYAAGYYSYKWAEVLAADAFAAFEEAGAFHDETARRFRDSILAVGGSRDAMEAFIAFRGRRPDASALLRQSGIAA